MGSGGAGLIPSPKLPLWPDSQSTLALGRVMFRLFIYLLPFICNLQTLYLNNTSCSFSAAFLGA